MLCAVIKLISQAIRLLKKQQPDQQWGAMCQENYSLQYLQIPAKDDWPAAVGHIIMWALSAWDLCAGKGLLPGYTNERVNQAVSPPPPEQSHQDVIQIHLSFGIYWTTSLRQLCAGKR